MYAILQAVTGQLHADERFQVHRAHVLQGLIIINGRDRLWIIGADFLAGEDDVNSIAGLCVGTIEKHRHAGGMTIDEPPRLQCLPGGLQVFALNGDIHIPCIPYDGLVRLRNPKLDRVATHDRIVDVCGFEGIDHTTQAIFHLLHGAFDPSPECVASEIDLGHRSAPRKLLWLYSIPRPGELLRTLRLVPVFILLPQLLVLLGDFFILLREFFFLGVLFLFLVLILIRLIVNLFRFIFVGELVLC